MDPKNTYVLMLVIVTLLSAILLDAGKSVWKLNNKGHEITSVGDITFSMKIKQSWDCAKECAKHGTSCSAFTVVQSSKTCFGYRTAAPGVRLWTRTCSYHGFEKVSGLNKCIKFSKEALTWRDASLACRANGTRLLRLDKQENLTEFVSGIKEKGYWWIGGRDTGVNYTSRDWRWENGVEVKYRLWIPQMDSLSPDMCIRMNQLRDFVIGHPCSSARRYICQEDI